MSYFTHITSRNIRSQRSFLSVLCILVFAMTSSLAMGGKTLIILSSESAPYVSAAAACEKQLNSSGILTERVLLSQLDSQEIQQIKDSVISIGGRASAKLARELPPAVHLYYCMTPSPARIGLTKRPNTSGIRTEIDIQAQIKLIQTGMPKAKRIGVLYRSSSATSTERVETLRSAVPLNWKIISIDLDQEKSASKGIKKLLSLNIDLVWTDPDTSVYNSATIKSLLLESLREVIPVFGFSHALVRAGATFGTRVNPVNQGKRAAVLLTTPSTMQSHNSAKPELVINLIAAKRIKLKLTDSFIRMADSVFK